MKRYKNTKKLYVLTIYDKNKNIVHRETRKSEQSFDRLWCKALSNINQLKYSIKATIEECL